MAWWHANNFPQHWFADVFDDVIGNVRASGGIGDLAIPPEIYIYIYIIYIYYVFVYPLYICALHMIQDQDQTAVNRSTASRLNVAGTAKFCTGSAVDTRTVSFLPVKGSNQNACIMPPGEGV